jgi:chemotaxis protein CheX
MQPDADQAEPQIVALHEHLDLPAAADLAKTLDRLRGRPVDLDASQVRHLGGLAAQVLASAALAWGADGTAFRIVNGSTQFGSCLRLLGMDAILKTTERSL